MDPESSVVSSPGWIWLVECLANDDRADYLTLHDAASKLPVLYGSAAEYARELLSLRCLEGLVEIGNDAEGAPTHSGSKIGLDLAQRCSVALLRITSEAGVSRLGGSNGLDVSKWDIQSFVEHKRAKLLHRCTLQLAVEMTDESIDPAALPRESSRINAVEVVAEGVSLTGDGTRHHQVVVGINSIPHDEYDEGSCQNRSKEMRNLEEEVDIHSTVCKSTEDNHVSNNWTFLVSDNGDGVPDEHGAIPPLKDDGSDSGKEPQNNASKFEKCFEKRVLDDQDFHFARDNQKPDAPNTAMCKKQPTVIPVADEINITNKARNQNVDDGPVGESVAKTSSCCFQDEREAYIVWDIPSEDEDYHNVEVVVASWKNNYMSSRCPTFDLAEPALCMKCSKSGPLLCCSSSGCPVAFHVNCLGSAPFFEDDINFRRPFCACFWSTAEYLEAKKKVNIRKRELISYLGSSQPSKYSQRVLNRNRNRKRHLKQDDPSYSMISHGVPEMIETNRKQANQNVEHVKHISPEFSGDPDVKAREPSGLCVDGVIDQPPVLR